jgi:hypothetical protein
MPHVHHARARLAASGRAIAAMVADVDDDEAHPRGPIRAGGLLASWVAHNLFHLRQLVRIRYAYLERRAAPYRLGYAGPW